MKADETEARENVIRALEEAAQAPNAAMAFAAVEFEHADITQAERDEAHRRHMRRFTEGQS